MSDTDVERRLREALQRSVVAEIPSPNLKASVERRILRSVIEPQPSGVGLIGWLRSPHVARRALAVAAVLVILLAGYSAVAEGPGRRIVATDGGGPGPRVPIVIGPLLPRAPSPGSIAFTVVSQQTTETGVWLVAPDGSGLRRIDHSPPQDPQLNMWSSRICPRDGVGAKLRRDGKALLFSPGTNCGLWSVNLDGTGLKPINAGGSCQYGCDWSPDGRSIVYETRIGGATPSTHLVISAADGSAPTDIGVGKAPEWSPDGKLIAFQGASNNIALFEVASRATRLVVSGARS
ncbi:MAG: hypothetical protein M3256_06310, partial [Actinomycetota bacterium]|nr:hypothetical protein [Actinomycetota bacterium]